MNRRVINRAAVKMVVKMLQSITAAIMAGSKGSTSFGLCFDLKKGEFSGFGAIAFVSSRLHLLLCAQR